MAGMAGVETSAAVAKIFSQLFSGYFRIKSSQGKPSPFIFGQLSFGTARGPEPSWHQQLQPLQQKPLAGQFPPCSGSSPLGPAGSIWTSTQKIAETAESYGTIILSIRGRVSQDEACD